MSTMPRPESTPQPGEEWDADGSQEPEFKPLTREEAQRWRAGQPEVSVWRLTQSAPVAWSVLYGAAAVVIPSALMAYGLTSSFLARLLAGVAQAAFAGFLLWEGVKIVLAVAMLWLAPTVVPELSWLGLLAGLVLTLKVYWFGFWTQTRRSNVNG